MQDLMRELAAPATPADHRIVFAQFHATKVVPFTGQFSPNSKKLHKATRLKMESLGMMALKPVVGND